MDTSIITGLIIGLIVGLAAGAGAAWLWLRYGAARDGADARKQAKYREEVADHFVKTAELVNRLTDSYKEVFDHLRDGAGNLVDEETLRQRLAHEEDKDVTLHLIGYRESGTPKSSQKRGTPDGGGKDSASGKGGEAANERK